MSLTTKYNLAIAIMAVFGISLSSAVGGFIGLILLFGVMFCGGMYFAYKYDALYEKGILDDGNVKNYKAKTGFFINNLLLCLGIAYVILANYLYITNSDYLQDLFDFTSSVFVILSDVPTAQVHASYFENINRPIAGAFWMHIKLFLWNYAIACFLVSVLLFNWLCKTHYIHNRIDHIKRLNKSGGYYNVVICGLIIFGGSVYYDYHGYLISDDLSDFDKSVISVPLVMDSFITLIVIISFLPRALFMAWSCYNVRNVKQQD